MSYIISKLEVAKMRTIIIYWSNNEDDCKAKLLDLIRKNSNINKVVENDYIMSYNVNKGYVYNSKTLESIYQILKISENEERDC